MEVTSKPWCRMKILGGEAGAQDGIQYLLKLPKIVTSVGARLLQVWSPA